LLKELKQLALLQQEEASTLNLNLAKDFKKTKVLFNKRLNSFKLNFFFSKCDGPSHAHNSYCTRLALKPTRTAETA
jgi:hypothetical protein